MSFTGISKTNYIVSQGSYGNPQDIRDRFIQRLFVDNGLLLQLKLFDAIIPELNAQGITTNEGEKLRNQLREELRQQSQNNNLSQGIVGTGQDGLVGSIGPQVIFDGSSNVSQITIDNNQLQTLNITTPTIQLLNDISSSAVPDIVDSNLFTNDRVGKDINLIDDYELILQQIDADVQNIKNFDDFAALLFKIGGNIADPIKSIRGNYFIIVNNTVERIKPTDLISQLFEVASYKVSSQQKNPPPREIELKHRKYYAMYPNIPKFINLLSTYFNKFILNSYYSTSLIVRLSRACLKYVLNKSLLNRRTYEEYAFSYQTPLEADLVQKTNFGNSLFYDVKTEYNFYSQLYEETIKSNNVSETLLPNLYLVTHPSVSENKDGLPLEHVTLKKNMIPRYDQFYFENWAKAVSKITDINSLQSLKSSMTNIGIQRQDFITLSDKNLDREDFPMYTTINFSTTNVDDKYSFIDVINKDPFVVRAFSYGFSNFSVPNFINTLETRLFNNLHDNPTLIEQGIKIIKQNEFITVQSVYSSSTKPLICFGLNMELGAVLEYTGSPIRDYFFTAKDNKSNDLFTFLNPLEFSNNGISNRSRLVELIERTKQDQNKINYFSNRRIDLFNPPKEIQNSETMLYRIAKYRVSFVNGQKTRQLIQNYYVPNFSDVANFSMYDTQIKYGFSYEYEATALQLFFSNTYTYYPIIKEEFPSGRTPVLITDNGASLEVTTAVEPTRVGDQNFIYSNPVKYTIGSFKNVEISTPYVFFFLNDMNTLDNISFLKLMETPYFTKQILVRDSPPITPDVSVVFFKDVSNVVKFMFNSQTGLKYEEPIIVENADKQMFDTIKLAQERYEEKTIKFESEDPPSYFEVYKLTTKPTSYKDFQGSRVYQVLPKFESFAGDVVDLIIPNTKNYYMFRVVDVHNQVSNPTSCFEIEIVNDNGKVYPILNIIDLKPKPEEENKTKKLKRFLHIKPSTNQKEIRYQNNNDSSALTNKIDIGANDSVWGRKFKIRVKSKLSNKVVDLNVTFDKQHIISKDEKDLTS
jgi:hypothetical protein